MPSWDFQSVRDSLRTQLWPIPLTAVVIALVLGQFLPFLDQRVDDSLPPTISGLLFGGGPEAARSLLETIAGSMITVTSLTFSLTVVTLQLASSQFSPRLLRTFTSDRFVHNTLALFLATFAFSLTVLRSIRVETSSGDSFVPELAVTTAFLLTIGSVIGLVLFLAHLARQIRVETMLRDVHRDADRTLSRVYPEQGAGRSSEALPNGGGVPLKASSSGFLTRIDEKSVAAAAERARSVISIDVPPGTSLVAGMPVMRAWATDDMPLEGQRLKALEDQLARSVRTGFERTSTQDPSFGLQQLLDVTDKALSPGINDPTTAVHALSHISAVLCSLTGRAMGPKTIRDSEGTARVHLDLPSFDQLLELAMDQLLTYAFADPRTADRTVEMLFEIITSAGQAGDLPAHLPAISAQLNRVDAAIQSSSLDTSIRERLNARLLRLYGQ